MEKKAQLTADFLRDALTGDGGGRRVTATCASPDGETFVVTAERTRVYGAPFAGIPREAVLSRLGEGQPLLLGGEAYSILGSFRDRFAVLLEKCARDPEAYEEAFSVTIEGRSGLLRLYAIEVGELTTHALRSLPADLAVIRRAGSTRDGRERGRKVGGAAKDLAALRLLGVTLEDLRDLEASGNEEALAAIDKDRVFPPIPLDELRTRGIPPAVAYLFTAIHRSFPRRPPPSSRGRSTSPTFPGS